MKHFPGHILLHAFTIKTEYNIISGTRYYKLDMEKMKAKFVGRKKILTKMFRVRKALYSSPILVPAYFY